MTAQPDEEHAPQEFASLLLELNKGRTHDELSEKFAELIRAVKDTRKGGKLVFTVNVKPAENVDDMVVAADDIKVTLPQLARTATMFYANDAGELSRDHPNQQTIFSIQGEQTR